MEEITKSQLYSVNQQPVETLLSWIKSGEIAVPEIQRPFVWKTSKVRDLMDSFYRGYPVGYIIVWRNPNVRLKDGSQAEGKKILIDGQQRITALMAALLGQPVVNKDYKRGHIRIAFNPLEEKFEVLNQAIRRDAAWLPDIAEVVAQRNKLLTVIRAYMQRNPDADEDLVYERISRLLEVMSKQIGVIELDADLDIEKVTDIFIRINSKGVVLSQADFAMSKIAAAEKYGGTTLRKTIDYFCHLAVAPGFYDKIKEGDKGFAASPHMDAIAWLRKENDDLYDPSYTDLLRVAFTSEFERGKLSDLVSLLSGRNFEQRTYEEDIAEASFEKLRRGVDAFINETHFKRFVMIIKSAGFVSSKLISSQNTLNLAYALYLKLRADGMDDGEIEKYVRRWFVMSVLTKRFSGAAETAIEYDIRAVARDGIADYLAYLESAQLSDAFWNAELPTRLNTATVSSPYYLTYLAAQVRDNDKGFLSNDITVRDLILHKGDVHHIFPRELLKSHGYGKQEYNQLANLVYTQSEINIRMGKRAPYAYLQDVTAQIENGKLRLGGITDRQALEANFHANAVPLDLGTKGVNDYPAFLEERRYLMAQKLRAFYNTL